MIKKRLGNVVLAGLIAIVGPGLFSQRAINETLAFPVALPTGSYTLELAWDEFSYAMALAHPPGETNELWVAERAGRIRVITDLAANTIQTSPVLDISTLRAVTTNGENGLLGLAFHPNFVVTKRFFVFYCHNLGGVRRNRVSSFEVTSEAPYIADPATEIVYFDQRDQASNHNGGDLHFGPDGYLYIALGDEGGGDDSYSNSQLVDRDFFSGLLRLDVDKRPGNVEPTVHDAIPTDAEGHAYFRVPVDNPLVAQWQLAGADPASPLRLEFYAIGLRNPWRFSFDPPTGRLWLGDVGQLTREEINLVVKGGNYGWALREGFLPFTKGPGYEPPVGFSVLSDPLYDYPRSDGRSITGGVVYRGTRLPELEGAYIFGDYGSGRVWALFEDPEGGAPTRLPLTIYSSHFEYGVDPSNGDILISGGDSAIRRLVRGDGGAEPVFPSTLSATGAFQSLETLEPEAGLLPYEPNVAFWSDFALKSRWVAIPDALIGYAQDAPWMFPEGMIWVKHFDLPLERGNPASTVRVETRFLVKTARGAYGLSYRWNSEETEAFLADEAGEDIVYDIVEDGVPSTQIWRIPSRQECLQCHTGAAGYALSFNTRQLNRTQEIDDVSDNLLQYLSNLGVFDEAIGEPNDIPRLHSADDKTASLLGKVGSYLAVNCVSCHQPGAVASSSWDARPWIGILDTGLIGGVALNDGGDPGRRLVVPGDPEVSVLLSRMEASHGFGRMPNIGSNEIDPGGTALLREWIASISAASLAWQISTFPQPELREADFATDADLDGAANLLEYLTGTDALDPLSVWRPNLRAQADRVDIQFPTVKDRLFTVRMSSDLLQWAMWEVEGNPHTSHSPETVTIDGAGFDSPLFFEVEVKETTPQTE